MQYAAKFYRLIWANALRTCDVTAHVIRAYGKAELDEPVQAMTCMIRFPSLLRRQSLRDRIDLHLAHLAPNRSEHS